MGFGVSLFGNRLRCLIEPIVRDTDCTLWGLECIRGQQGNALVLRVYIHHAQSAVTVEHCAQVSRLVSALLEVENPFQQPYSLELSSPGIYPRFFSIEQLEQALGNCVAVTLKHAVDHQRSIVGELLSVGLSECVVQQGIEQHRLRFDKIEEIHKSSYGAQFIHEERSGS